MGFYPVSLDLTDRPCVVIGGGVIAERRVAALLEAGASVTLVSPSLTVALASLADAGRIRHVARGYEQPPPRPASAPSG
jgi:precorrin-2 dehydrogenase/sirohydrochlorin ferrochelatase